MIFGVFDGIHDGHRFFIEEAMKLGDTLVISVADDDASEHLKHRRPKRVAEDRIKDLTEAFPNAAVIRGDKQESSWLGLLDQRPSVVALGYDQDKLKLVLENARASFPFLFELITIGDHKGDTLHSSMLES